MSIPVKDIKHQVVRGASPNRGPDGSSEVSPIAEPCRVDAGEVGAVPQQGAQQGPDADVCGGGLVGRPPRLVVNTTAARAAGAVDRPSGVAEFGAEVRAWGRRAAAAEGVPRPGEGGAEDRPQLDRRNGRHFVAVRGPQVLEVGRRGSEVFLEVTDRFGSRLGGKPLLHGSNETHSNSGRSEASSLELARKNAHTRATGMVRTRACWRAARGLSHASGRAGAKGCPERRTFRRGGCRRKPCSNAWNKVC